MKDYTTDLYEPAAAHADDMAADGHRRACEMATWKRHLVTGWSDVRVEGVESDGAAPGIGDERSVDAIVSLGSLSGRDVEVQLVHGIVGQGDELERPQTTAMAEVERVDDSRVRYRGTFACDAAGRYGFTVRVLPVHEDLSASAEMGRVAWA